MALFEIEAMTKAKFRDVVILGRKNREPGERSGCKIKARLELTHAALAYFDPALAAMLFAAAKATNGKRAQQPDLPDVEETPDLTHIGREVGRLPWGAVLTGYTLTIDHGTGGKRNLVVNDCTLHTWRFGLKDGGSMPTDCVIESANVARGMWDSLADLKLCDVLLTLTPPSIEDQQQQELDGADAGAAEPPAQSKAAAKRVAKKTATEEFIARNTKGGKKGAAGDDAAAAH